MCTRPPGYSVVGRARVVCGAPAGVPNWRPRRSRLRKAVWGCADSGWSTADAAARDDQHRAQDDRGHGFVGATIHALAPGQKR